MQLTVVQEDLKAALDVVKRSSTSHSSGLQALSDVLITANEDVTLKCTDLQGYAVRHLKAVVREAGEALVPVATLSEFISTLPNDVVTIKSKKGSVTIECARFASNIRSHPADEFPTVPEVPTSVNVDGEVLKKVLDRVVYAAAQDDARPTLMGVLLEGGERFTAVAADGFRMAVSHADIPVGDLNVIVPARALKELARVISGPIGIGTNGNHIAFKCGDTEIGTRLIEGRYPAYGQILPNGEGTRIIVDVVPFLAALKSTAIFARNNSNIIHLSAEHDALVLTGCNPEEGDSVVTLDAETTGNIKFALNARYLGDTLNALGAEKATFIVASPSSPVMILPVGDDTTKNVVMPMEARR